MKQLDYLMLDFQAELNQNGFGNKSWEDDSYQYMVNVVEYAYELDSSIPKKEIMRLLDDTSVSLQQAYFNVLEFLEKTQNGIKPIPTKRKAELFDVLIEHLIKMFCDINELKNEFDELGFTDEEIYQVLYHEEETK